MASAQQARETSYHSTNHSESRVYNNQLRTRHAVCRSSALNRGAEHEAFGQQITIAHSETCLLKPPPNLPLIFRKSHGPASNLSGSMADFRPLQTWRLGIRPLIYRRRARRQYRRADCPRARVPACVLHRFGREAFTTLHSVVKMVTSEEMMVSICEICSAPSSNVLLLDHRERTKVVNVCSAWRLLAEGVQSPCFIAGILVGRKVKLGDGLSLFGRRKGKKKRC